jgi:hypothetical protein
MFPTFRQRSHYSRVTRRFNRILGRIHAKTLAGWSSWVPEERPDAAQVAQRRETMDVFDLAVFFQRKFDGPLDNIRARSERRMAIGAILFSETAVMTVKADVAGRLEAILDQERLRFAAQDGSERGGNAADGPGCRR